MPTSKVERHISVRGSSLAPPSPPPPPPTELRRHFHLHSCGFCVLENSINFVNLASTFIPGYEGKFLAKRVNRGFVAQDTSTFLKRWICFLDSYLDCKMVLSWQFLEGYLSSL